MESLDYEDLRRDLIDYFGSATPMFSMAYMDVYEVEQASDEELVQIAEKNGFDLDDYKEYVYRR